MGGQGAKGGALQEPNYEDIKLTPEQQSIIYDHIEQFWTEYAGEASTDLTVDQAKEMLMKVSEDNFINQGVFDQAFAQEAAEGAEKLPLEIVSKEQMHQCAQIYILFMERQRTKEIYEAEVQLAQLNQDQQEGAIANMNGDMPPVDPALQATTETNENVAAQMTNEQEEQQIQAE